MKEKRAGLRQFLLSCVSYLWIWCESVGRGGEPSDAVDEGRDSIEADSAEAAAATIGRLRSEDARMEHAQAYVVRLPAINVLCAQPCPTPTVELSLGTLPGCRARVEEIQQRRLAGHCLGPGLHPFEFILECRIVHRASSQTTVPRQRCTTATQQRPGDWRASILIPSLDWPGADTVPCCFLCSFFVITFSTSPSLCFRALPPSFHDCARLTSTQHRSPASRSSSSLAPQRAPPSSRTWRRSAAHPR